MASNNEFVVPERYEDLTPAPQVDQATLNRMVWRSYWLQSSFNYETMQSGGWLFAMVPGLEKVHTNKKDLAASMYHNLDFINTHPFLVTFVMGIVLSLEQNKVDTQTILSVRISAASPLGGIGDALFWLTLVPITAGITSNMAISGNILGPVIFLVVFHAALFACRFGLMNWAYKLGTSAIDALMGSMQAFTRAAAIMGCFVVGCLTVAMGGTQINLVIPNGTTNTYTASTVTVPNADVSKFDVAIGDEVGSVGTKDADGAALKAADANGDPVKTGVTDLGNGYSSVTYATITSAPVSFSVADTLDTVMPKLVPLALVMLLYFLFSKKNFTPMAGIVLVLAIGIIGAFPLNEWFGIEWWTGLW